MPTTENAAKFADKLTSEHISVDQQGAVGVISFDRPQKKNALTVAMYVDLVAMLRAMAADDTVRVVLLQGNGGNFTSGNDLVDFMNSPPLDESSPVFQALATLHGYEKPVVTAVEGVAIGIGTTFLLHTDLNYLAPTTRLQMPFVNLGLVPEAASSVLVPQMAGLARASELLLLGDMFDAQTALSCGFASQVVAADVNVQEYAMKKAQQLAAKAPEAVRLSKKLLRKSRLEPNRTIDSVLREEAAIFAARLSSPEAMEAFQAFFERRAPDFSRFV